MINQSLGMHLFFITFLQNEPAFPDRLGSVTKHTKYIFTLFLSKIATRTEYTVPIDIKDGVSQNNNVSSHRDVSLKYYDLFYIDE